MTTKSRKIEDLEKKCEIQQRMIDSLLTERNQLSEDYGLLAYLYEKLASFKGEKFIKEIMKNPH